jgi:hypothetical protein
VVSLPPILVVLMVSGMRNKRPFPPAPPPPATKVETPPKPEIIAPKPVEKTAPKTKKDAPVEVTIEPEQQKSAPKKSAENPPPSLSMPAFPWPPPQPSTRVVVPRAAFEECKNFGELSSSLDQALTQTGYVEKSYYAVPGGIGIVTRLERIYPDGRPFERSGRWLTENTYLQKFSLASYLRALFTASEGYYRVIVFIVTDVPFASGDGTMTSREATSLLARGFNTLPGLVSTQSLPADYVCTSLIYEFRREQGKDPAQLLPGQLDAKTHLVASGLWTALRLNP